MNDPDPQRQLAAALGRIPSGLFVLTVRHGEAETGMLVSWVQQCSFDPPQITLALKRGREIGRWLDDSTRFVLNVLDDTQTDMVVHFGRGFELDQPAFEGVEVERLEDRPPVLQEALAYLECQVISRSAVGDHDLIVGQILAGRMLGEGQPMVHIRKSGQHY